MQYYTVLVNLKPKYPSELVISILHIMKLLTYNCTVLQSYKAINKPDKQIPLHL